MNVRKIIKYVILMAILSIFTSCNVIVAVWDSIKDRYEPYEFVGEEGDKVLVKFVFDSVSSTDVWLAGEFNNWAAGLTDPRYPDRALEEGGVIELTMDDSGFWTVTIPLSPGRYQYKYVIDEGRVWREDYNTETVPDGFGGNNSIIIVTAQ